MSGVTFNTTVSFDSAKIKNACAESLRKAQTPLDAMIMADSNYFVPLKTGMLQQSAIINTRLGSGEIVWRTPYARRLYYEYERPPNQANPNACAKWVEAAKARWLDKWVRLVNEYIERS